MKKKLESPTQDLYASHVTKARKDKALQGQLALAERIRSGTEPCGFWLWQRLNQELTGDCVGFLSQSKRN